MTRQLRWTLALCLALPSVSIAQTVQKCIARDDHVRYQSAPCAKGERVDEVWVAMPDPVESVDDGIERRRSRPTRRGPPKRRSSRSATLERRVADVADDRCERARAYRDAGERRAGLDRDYDLLTTLQRRVFDACR